MKKITFLLLTLPFFVQAQKTKSVAKLKTEINTTATGVQFEHLIPNWNSLVARAKKENKFIFVDCYTTWCGPCKQMSNQIFPQKEVGDFYNENFINVKLQLDVTAKDNEDVVKTRAVAKQIETAYKVVAYPTFLVFNAQGKIVHKFVGGGDAKDIIEKGKDALVPENQYYTALEKYKNGDKKLEHIIKLCKLTEAAFEKGSNEYLKEIIAKTDNVFTKEIGDIIVNLSMTTNNNVAIEHLTKNRGRWKEVLESNDVDDAMENIIEEDLMQAIADKGKVEIDWAEISKTYTEKYPEYFSKMLGPIKITYYAQKKDWKNYANSIDEYMSTYGATITNENQLNQYAWNVFENVDNKEILTKAINWSKKSFAKSNNPMFIDTYANLLYKLNRKEEAIETEIQAMNLAPAAEKSNYQETIDKMKKGEKTWK